MDKGAMLMKQEELIKKIIDLETEIEFLSYSNKILANMVYELKRANGEFQDDTGEPDRLWRKMYADWAIEKFKDLIQ